jgi:putative PIN family toxin of toxin-antitoxin system
MPERVVFDCTLFVQAVASDKGPAFACLTAAEQGRVTLLLSADILAEVQDVLSRPLLRAKLPILTPQRVETFMSKIKSVGVLAPHPPHAFTLPRDRNDEPYTDLAVAANARYLVTWNDRHLSYLMRKDTPEGMDFCRRFPRITILSPPAFLEELTARESP